MSATNRWEFASWPSSQPQTTSIAELYHENTKLRRSIAELFPPREFSITQLEAMSHSYRRYRLGQCTPLPKMEGMADNPQTFDSVIAARRTLRKLADADLSLANLAKILYQSYGVTGGVVKPGGGIQPYRAVPSAGALYPCEVYLGIRRVLGLMPGLYHYDVLHHALDLFAEGDRTETFYEMCLKPEFARQAAVVILISSTFERSKSKYGERAYRYVLLEAGHLAQNICLAGSALGLAVITIGGFLDDDANALLRLDGTDEAVVYLAFIGVPGEMKPVELEADPGIRLNLDPP